MYPGDFEEILSRLKLTCILIGCDFKIYLLFVGVIERLKRSLKLKISHPFVCLCPSSFVRGLIWNSIQWPKMPIFLQCHLQFPNASHFWQWIIFLFRDSIVNFSVSSLHSNNKIWSNFHSLKPILINFYAIFAFRTIEHKPELNLIFFISVFTCELCLLNWNEGRKFIEEVLQAF